MKRKHNNLIQRTSALFLCALMLLGVLPFSVIAADDLLATPTSVSLTDMDGTEFIKGQEVMPGEGFNVIYNYGTVADIDSEAKYKLPVLSNQLEVIRDAMAGNGEIASLPVAGADGLCYGTLEINILTGAMTFQFEPVFDQSILNGFFLQFGVQLDEGAVQTGDTIEISFPIQGGNADFELAVADTEKDPPKLVKKGALSADASPSGNIEILWTITVTNGENPYKSIIIRDTWSTNQEYVDGSFCIGGVPVTSGLSQNDAGNGFEYEHTGIKPDSVDIITYKTRIKSSAFLSGGVPLKTGSISCTNTAQAFTPGDGGIALPSPAKASYSHPVTWLYKTSGNVIDRKTGEMEWTITIYNNGLDMRNVTLYDRLSPGVSVKGSTATIQIGNNPARELVDFKRISGADLLYNSEIGKEYNISYPLGDIGSVAVIKYRTIITNTDEYNAGAYMPPDTIFDNRAFITYMLPSGTGLSSMIASPVVEKSGGYDTGLIGKAGEIETAYHTIKWTMTVNGNDELLEGVTVTDKLTYAAPLLTLPDEYRLCNHVYDDSIARNKPQYSFDGVSFTDFSPYDTAKPNLPFTYRLVPTDKEVYEIVFYLGDTSKKVIISFRSTATDKIIFANNVTSGYCGYENKASLITNGNEFSYASADVVYKSDVFQKNDARSWFNKAEHTYNFADNQLPWLMRVNINEMEMTDICITDILSEGTSLVKGKMIIGNGTGAWYKLNGAAGTVAVPEYTDGAKKPYYTYNEATRELKIYPEDITGSVVGTSDATKQIVFYVQVDVDHRVFNDPTYKNYIENDKGIWAIPNTGVMTNNYLSGDDAVEEGAAYNVYVQHMDKDGTAYKNGEHYTIDYSLYINRIQQTLPKDAVVKDILPAGLRLDASTLRLYEATVISPDEFYVKDDGTNGTVKKGNELDRLLYQAETVLNNDGTTTLRIILPKNSGTKMYVAEYSCDVTDISKAPFTNSAVIEGVAQSEAEQIITRLILNTATAGGTLQEVEKTVVSLSKTDSVSGGPIKGAVFGIYYKGVLIESKTTDENGQLVFENLNKNYTYTVTELSAALGYLTPFGVTETFVASDNELEFENTPIVGTVQFIKTDRDGDALAGAEFGIWSNASDIGLSSPLATASSQQNGTVTFFSLTAGRTYYIAEITAPENYQKSDEVIIAKMGTDGTVEKLWLMSDKNETAVTSFANTLIPQITYTALTVTKVWNDDNSPSRPISVSVMLYCNGEEYEDAVVLNAENNWTAAYSQLDDSYEWTVDEIDVPDGYTASVIKDGTQWTITNNKISDATVHITGAKTLTGGNKTTADITDGQFMFSVISDSENDVTGFAGLKTAAAVKEGGEIDFGTLTFSKAGTYKFTITENDLGEIGYTYDKTVFNAEIIVNFDQETNSMEAELAITRSAEGNGENEAVTAIEFANTYIPDNPYSPPTGDNYNIVLWITALMLSAMGIICCGLYGTAGSIFLHVRRCVLYKSE